MVSNRSRNADPLFQCATSWYARSMPPGKDLGSKTWLENMERADQGDKGNDWLKALIGMVEDVDWNSRFSDIN